MGTVEFWADMFETFQWHVWNVSVKRFVLSDMFEMFQWHVLSFSEIFHSEWRLKEFIYSEMNHF